MIRLITIILLLLMALPVGYAKKKPPKEMEELLILPPTPLAVEVEVLRGQRVTIPLKAVARTEPAVRFILRSQPVHGTLGTLLMTDASAGTLTYTHSGEPTATEDGFLFAARSSGSGVSAAVKVKIKIVERPPQFVATDAINFGSIYAGGRVSREVVMQNRGGGVAKGNIILPKGWELDGGTSYALGRQQEKTLRITFAPGDVREYRDRIAYTSAPRVVTVVSGSAFEPFTVTPERIEVTDRNAREDVLLTINNQTPEPAEAMLTADPRFDLPKTIIVQPEASTPLPLDIAKLGKTAIREKITITFGNRQLTVPVRVVALPANITIQPADLIAFPDITVGETLERTITIENTGGTTAEILLDAPQPFRFPNRSVKVSIAPDSTETIQIRAAPTEAGTITKVLTLTTEKETMAIPITLTALPLAGTQAAVALAKAEAAAPATTPGQDEEVYVPGVWKPTPPVDYASYFKLIKTTPVSLTLEWPSKLEANAIHRLEARHTGMASDGHIVFDWRPFEDATFSSGDGVMRATLEKLKPNSRYRLRLFSHPPDVREPQPAYIPPVSTPPREPPRIRLIHILLAIAALSGTAVLTKRLRR